MRPSQYHYLKRMWTRYFYNKNQRKQRKSILTLPFRLLHLAYAAPFKVFTAPFKAFSNSAEKRGRAKKILKYFLSIAMIIFIFRITVFLINNFFDICGIGIVVTFLLTIAFAFVLIYIKDVKSKSGQIKKTETLISDIGKDAFSNDVNEPPKVLLSESPLGETRENVFLSHPKDNIEKHINMAQTNSLKGNADPSCQKYKENKKISKYELERYAIMCNAHLEHQDEMDLYRSESLSVNSGESEK